ncbi:nucleic acid-binding, OB-fold protein [Tanacetum coccineum]
MFAGINVIPIHETANTSYLILPSCTTLNAFLMAPKIATVDPQLFLDTLEVGVTGTIILMVCQMWDVYAATGRYLSTDFIVCDSKGSTMHATTRGTIAHNFLKLKEGGIYSVKNFTVLPNKDEFRMQLGSKWTELLCYFVKSVPRANQYGLPCGDPLLYLSSTSSTLILDDEEIPEVKQLKSDSGGAEFNKELPSVGCSDV